jgi:hypothetical protein
VPGEAFGPLDSSGTLPLRDFGLVRPERYRRKAQFEPHPQLVVLSTRGDGPEQWLRAGQALQRVLLTATVRGVAAQPVTQALESPRLRALITHRDSGRYAQMILRIGYGLPAAQTPRRLLPDVLPDWDA